MNGCDVDGSRATGGFAPWICGKARREVRRHRRDRSDQPPIWRGDEHSVDTRMRVERAVEPTLRRRLRIGSSEDIGYIRLRLVVFDDPARAAEIVADEMG